MAAHIDVREIGRAESDRGCSVAPHEMLSKSYAKAARWVRFLPSGPGVPPDIGRGSTAAERGDGYVGKRWLLRWF